MADVVAAGMGRVVLTGATGFVGGALARSLSDAGWAITAILRETSDPATLDPRVAPWRHDGTTESLTELLGACAPDLVIHAATRFVGAHRPSDIPSLVEANILFATRLLEAMRAAGCRRFLNFGTAWQHFSGDAYEPATLYAATKQAFEDILYFYVKAHDVSALTIKLSDTYGPGDRRRKLIPLLFATAASGTPLAMSPGEQRLNLVHIGDVERAVLDAIRHLQSMPPRYAESFAVRGAETLPLRDLVAVFGEATGLTVPIRWGALPYRDREVMHPWLGPLLPGWSPRIAIRDGLRELAKDHAAHVPL